MVKLDNPVRIARLGARLSQKELAAKAGIARMTLVSIEEGTTRIPDRDTLDAVARVLDQDADSLNRALVNWHDDQPQFTYTPSQLISACDGAETFREFRTRLEPSATQFASKLGVARATLTGYEAGKRKNGMPDTLQAGLLAVGCPLPMLEELEDLPAS